MEKINQIIEAVIKNMLKKEMPISTISELTGLSEDEIENLQANE